METAPAKTFLGFKPVWVLCIPKSPKSSSSYFHNHPGTLTCLTWDHWKRREIQNTKIQKVPEKNLAQLKLWNPLSPTQHGWEVAWALQRSADECGAKMSAGFNCGKPLKSLKYFIQPIAVWSSSTFLYFFFNWSSCKRFCFLGWWAHIEWVPAF